MERMLERILLITTSTIAFSGQLAAQAYAELDINDIKARFYSHGLIGADLGLGDPRFEVPAGQGIHALYSAGLWMGGLSPDNQLHVAAARFEGIVDGDYWPGPLDSLAGITALESQNYDQVWVVDRADILAHRAYFDCLNDPNCDESVLYPGGYTIPSVFLDWPAMGDVTIGQAMYLAPFIDYDGDGYYDPANGDHPCIAGDRALYFIFNDAKAHALTSGLPLGVEVHGMAYAFGSGSAALQQTLFLHYRVINRSTTPYSDMRIGLYSDLDLGNGMDDFVGTDVARNLVYVLNGDANDEDGFTPGYGGQPPAFGIVQLSGGLLPATGADEPADNNMPAFNGYGFGDGLVDNERSGLSVTRAFGNGFGPTGEPTTAPQYHYQLEGHFNDGTSQLYGGTGHISSSGADPNTPSLFIYPDASDPFGAGTNGVAQAPWSEASAVNQPGDRRILTSQGPFDMVPGWHGQLHYAFVFARASSGGPQASVAALQQRVDSVQAFFEQELRSDGFEEDPWCVSDFSLGLGAMPAMSELAVWPNPTEAQLFLTVPADTRIQELLVHDAAGRTVIQRGMVDPSGGLDVSSLAQGHYVLLLRTDRGLARARFVRR